MSDTKVNEPVNWPDMAMSLWDGLTGRKAEITYHFEKLDVSIPHRVGANCEHATWGLNGVLKISTTDKTQA